jgi:hypothetical protein
MFKSPIELLENKSEITNNTNTDLQLNLVYNDLFGKKENTSSVRKTWMTTMTSDTKYLKETQLILQRTIDDYPSDIESDSIKIQAILQKMYTNPSFKEKYEYITVNFFEKLNHHELMLQVVSMYTLSTPLITLLTPFIMLFIPFFILKIMKKPVTLNNYIPELKRVFAMLPIGKIFQLSNISMEQRGMVLFSIILYFVNIYQNTLTCYKFYKNTHEMVKEIYDCGHYCNAVSDSMDKYCEVTQDYTSYNDFTDILKERSLVLKKMGANFLAIKKETFKDMGKKMKVYYDLYCNKDYKDIFTYCFGYSEYINNIRSLACIKHLKPCRFSKNKTSFTNNYYALIRNVSPIKNSLSLSKNAIFSGPNASGKTTMLKSIMINTILSQQIGMGFYDKASIKPVDYLHCYINIPDSCHRDSLFQAEARRCKEILDVIKSEPSASHFCVFDELFSGTNPYEAIACAYGYLDYLNNNHNVKYLLTTHYLELCEKINFSSKIINYTLEPKYTLKKGISKIKGGIKVIERLGFPQSIIKIANNMVS